MSPLTVVEFVTGKLMSHLLDREPAPEEGTCLTVLREDQVLREKGSCTADTSCLLTELCHVEGDAGLSLCLVVDDIGLIDHDHGAEHLFKRVLVDCGLVLLVDYIALLIKDAEALHLVE